MQNFCQEKSAGVMKMTCKTFCSSDVKKESKTSRLFPVASSGQYTQEEINLEAAHGHEKLRKLFALPLSQRTKEAFEEAMHQDFDRVKEELHQREPKATWGPQEWTQDVESTEKTSEDEIKKFIAQVFGVRFEEEPEGDTLSGDECEEEDVAQQEEQKRARKCSEAIEHHKLWNLRSCFVHPTPRGTPMPCQCDTLRPQDTHLYHVEHKPLFSEYVEKNKISVLLLTDLELDTYQKELRTQRRFCNDGIIIASRMSKVGLFAQIMAHHIRQLDRVEELLAKVDGLISLQRLAAEFLNCRY